MAAPIAQLLHHTAYVTKDQESLDTNDPNGMILELTCDVDGYEKINEERAQDAHETLKRWLAGDHTSNNNYR